ncbi:MAG: antitoxin family protein [Elusimicrobiota bacterium]
MSQIIPAIYEDGVFKPTKKVKFKEHQRIELIVKSPKDIVKANKGLVKANKKIIEKFALDETIMEAD